MNTRLASLYAILVLIGCGSTGLAQQDVSDKVEFRKWDIGTTVGLLGANKRDFGRSGSYNNDPSLSVNLDVGRYLTTHLKADAGLTWNNSRSFYDYNFSQTSPTEPGSYTIRTVRPTILSGAVTYQFFENAFTHPYVTTGLRLAILPEHRETYSFDNFVSRIETSVKQTSLQARPFGAVGFKSYFNERWFMRSELLVAWDAHGVSHGVGRIGFGIDF